MSTFCELHSEHSRECDGDAATAVLIWPILIHRVLQGLSSKQDSLSYSHWPLVIWIQLMQTAF